MEVIVPSRKMKNVFRWWWSNLSPGEQDRIREVMYAQYAKVEGIPVEGIAERVKEIQQKHREATARAKKQGE